MTDPFLHVLRTVLTVLGLALLLLAAHGVDHLQLPLVPPGSGQVNPVVTTLPTGQVGGDGRGGGRA